MLEKYSEPRHSTMRWAYTLLSLRRIVRSAKVGSLRKALYSFEGSILYSSRDIAVFLDVEGLLSMEDC